MLNSPISAAYCTLFFFLDHLQEQFDVMTRDFNTYHVESEEVLLAGADSEGEPGGPGPPVRSNGKYIV